MTKRHPPFLEETNLPPVDHVLQHVAMDEHFSHEAANYSTRASVAGGIVPMTNIFSPNMNALPSRADGLYWRVSSSLLHVLKFSRSCNTSTMGMFVLCELISKHILLSILFTFEY